MNLRNGPESAPEDSRFSIIVTQIRDYLTQTFIPPDFTDADAIRNANFTPAQLFARFIRTGPSDFSEADERRLCNSYGISDSDLDRYRRAGPNGRAGIIKFYERELSIRRLERMGFPSEQANKLRNENDPGKLISLLQEAADYLDSLRK